ncbi:cell wall anchor protein [[Clostridium] innocuum]|nr:cell wall anchor protein [[Clostridium] innocuum]
MKLKKRFRKLATLGMACLLTLTNMNGIVRANERATHNGTLNINTSVGWTYGGTSWGQAGRLTVNGEDVYCLERLVTTVSGAHYVGVEEDFSPAGITPAMKEKMSLLAYFGKKHANETGNPDWHAVAQSAIWREQGDGKGWLLSPTFNTKAKLDQAIQTLNNDVSKYYVKPSFNTNTINVKVGETIRLTDTNKVLNTFTVYSTSGLNVKIDGNDLVITGTANADENARIVLRKNISANETGVSILYQSPGLQKVGRFRVFDPERANLKVKVQKYGTLKLAKQDEDKNYVPNTSFKLSYKADMSNPIGTYTTGADGTVTIPNLLPQTVYVQETSVPSHLVLDSKIYSVTIKPNETVAYTATNEWKKGNIQVVKKDIDTGKIVVAANTTFNVHKEDGTIIDTITTDDTGTAKALDVKYGKYYLTEKTAPNGYIHSDEKVHYNITEDGKTYVGELSNKRVTASVELSKEDSITGKQPQGEATLKGAVYGLYARNDILDPADHSVIYKAGTKIAELTTDENGNASKDNLYLGDYFFKEIKASNGYTLDKKEYDFSLTYENQNVPVVTKKQGVLERVKAQAFSIIKISDNGNGEVDNLAGVEFTIKSQKDIDKYGSWEKAPIAKNAKGQTAKVLVTDSKGYAVSDELPFGSYVVRETKVPDDHFAVPDFKIEITEDSREPQPWRIFNDEKFKAVVSIVKQDVDTGKTVAIAGAKFKIKNLATNEYVGYWDWNPLPHYVNEWTTDESGTVMTGDKLEAGEYQIEEIKAPNGYLLDIEPVKFTVSSNGVYETLPDGKTPVITVMKKDKAVKGKINVEKRGEVLVGFDNGNFVYKERGLQGMTVNIYAKEDILDPSNDGTILYKKGTLVDTITTGENGKATTKKLPLGVYEIREVTAPNGMVINTKPQTIELEYKDQDTAIVYEDITFNNDRQKVNASLVKVDEDGTTGLSGAEFNIIAKEDIVNADNKVIVKAGTVLKKYTSDEDGNIAIDLDLPLNTDFALKETKAPIGYVLDQTEILFNTNYQGQDVDTIKISKTKENKRTEVSFSKTDVTTGKELAGNHLTIFEKDNAGNVFTSWISGDKPYVVENLSTDTRYVLRETSSVKGFYLATDIEFEIAKDGTVYIFDEDGNKVVAKDNLIVMENDLVTGRLNWNKSGEIFTSTMTGQTEFGKVKEPVWETSNLLGAEITIYAAEDITLGNGVTYYKKDEAIQILESDLEAVQSKDLLVGKYYYKETKVPHGYVVDTDKHYFEIKDNQSSEIQIVDSTLENDRPTIQVEFTKFMEQYQHHNKLDNAYKDVVFGIFAREDIYSYKGEVAIESGTMIGTTGIDELGQLEYVPDLPNGVYFLKELQTNPDYVLDTNEYDFEVAYHGQDVSSYKIVIGEDGTIENKLIRGSIQIMKKDSFDENKVLTGVPFNISANADMSEVITTVETDGNGIATFKDMELGKYYIQEAEQVGGYAINDHIYEVEITTNGELLTIEVDNKPTEMTFSKVDETGVKELAGAKMQVVSPKTKDIIDEWISTDEAHQIKYLVEGETYILREISAPNGYEVAEEIEFVAGDGKKVTMKDELILTDIQVNKVDSVTKEAIKHKDFEFTMYADEECTQVIRTVNANTENGTATFKDVPYGTYYIKETKAPKGYELSKEVKKVVVNDELEGVGDVHSFIYENILLPSKTINTGDTTNIMMYFMLGGASLLALIYVLSRKKKNEA